MVDAKRFNRVRLVLKRLSNPARLELTGIHDLELLIDDRVWVCVDTGLGNLPVMAWKDFDLRHRTALHEPVPCRIDYYNLHAELIRDRVLDIMDRLLEARLRRSSRGTTPQVKLFAPPVPRRGQRTH